MEYLAYIISLAATVLGLIEPFCKKMKSVLIFNLIGNILVGSSYLFTQSYSGSAICLVAALGLIANYQFTSREKNIPWGVIALHAVMFLGVNLVTFSAWYDIFALAASFLFVLSIAQKTTKHYRILYIANSLSWIVYDFCAGAYANLLTHGVLAVAIFAAILYRDRQKREDITEDGQ